MFEISTQYLVRCLIVFHNILRIIRLCISLFSYQNIDLRNALFHRLKVFFIINTRAHTYEHVRVVLYVHVSKTKNRQNGGFQLFLIVFAIFYL